MKIRILFATLLFNVFLLHAEEWKVPADAELKPNPLPFEIDNIVIGKRVYTRSCQSCHGSKADGKGKTKSTNLVSPKVQAQSDDILFYKIREGKDDMPGFDDLGEEEVWSVINFLRYAKSPEKYALAKSAYIEVSIPKKNKKKLKAFVYQIIEGDTVPQKEVNVNFFIKREFGRMRFSDDRTMTGIDGTVTIECPKKIIGDAEGNLLFYATIEDNILYNPVKDSIQQKWGVPMVISTLEEERSLASTREKTPIWLLFMANGIILIVWFFVVKVIFNLVKIKNQGKIYLK